jgi:hypothetical protein
MNEIRALIYELKKVLPKSSVKEIKKTSIVPPQVQKPAKELKKLEQELADIEAKLSEL